MKLGIIGLPQSGKTTLFNALTRGNAPTTASAGRIEVHQAVVDVPDPRVDTLSKMFNPRKTIYTKVAYADITLDPSTREAKRGDLELNLTVTEFNLLHMLLRHPRQVPERRQILNDVWGYDFGGDDNVLEIYVGYLRKKLEAGSGSRVIQTVRGIGYVLREE